ncbi:tRNA (adenosine(37)-N6)-dimethylallyltransferase MiaA [Candidatus Dojkabacteria bacterium]|nr:tRNA (adenosine(37)-N6)-dimethylallyltransferase MiaA [Candidatus Dojkabacteria bacterium]
MSREKSEKSKVYVIYGPTASGKTGMAIKLAKKINGEIINADSRQIYNKLFIGTDKPEVLEILPEFSEGILKININKRKFRIPQQRIKYKVRGWLFDIINPDEKLSLYEYQQLVYQVIENIIKRGKTPIVVGGTGLYIDAITKGYEIPQIEPDTNLRKDLEKLSTYSLMNKLKKLDPKKLIQMNNSDKNNPRRLIRAIEIIKGYKKNIETQNNVIKNYNFVYMRPAYSKRTLFKKIDKRVEEMFDRGLVEETGVLLAEYGKNIEVMKGMGYKEVVKYLEGKITLEETKKLIKLKHRQYVKRQETWSRKYIDNRRSPTHALPVLSKD